MDNIKFNGSHEIMQTYNNGGGNRLLVVNSPINSATYWNSTGGEEGNLYKFYNIDGNYYLCFDFQQISSNGGGPVSADGVYNDYVIKLIPIEADPTNNPTPDPGVDPDPTPDPDPVNPNPDPVTPEGEYDHRIMCEDLGDTDDFDFNDVVFDVKLNRSYVWSPELQDNNFEWIICLRAVGGTLPIYVGYDDERYEAHRLLGQNSETPINVGGVTASPIAYIVKIPVRNREWSIVTSPNSIPIYVKRNGAKLPATLIPSSGVSESPMKICVPTSTRWLKERVQIEKGYPHFIGWVKDEYCKYGFKVKKGENWFEDNPNGNWTKVGVNYSVLY